MLLLFHLLTGVVLGLFIYRLTGRKVAVWIGAVGALLPDIIDKPIGHLILHDSLDNGRLFGHTIVFLILLIMVGYVLRHRREGLPLLVLAGGVLLHHLADSMFLDLTTWSWPLLGPLASETYADYFGDALWRELGSAYEWTFGLVSLLLIILVQRSGDWGQMRLSIRSYNDWLVPVLFLSSLVFAIAGMLTYHDSHWSAVPEWYMAASAAAGSALALTVLEK
ncbi:MAG TPA: metal-dependent hydrolase [Methanomassiliicoccales archaeon]|nr:metal-dependent hydrolase [Methanomassiliicoccales archaeon]